jgi:hypothetical protein
MISQFSGRKEKERKNCFKNIIPICISPPCCGTFDVPPHYLPTDQQGLSIKIEQCRC